MTTKSISNEDITIDVNHETYRIRMYRQAIFDKMYPLLEELTSELELPSFLVDQSLSDFGKISARCVVMKGELDFEFAEHNDTTDDIKTKFLVFVDSKYISLLDEVATAIITMDRAQDDELAPPSSDKKK